MIQKLSTFLIILCFVPGIFAQDSSVSKSLLPMIQFNYAYQIPAADLQNRFGNNSNVGVAFLLKNSKNFQFGIQGEAIFDGKVIEPGVLDPIRNDNGHFTDADGEPIVVTTEERGLAIFLTAAKIIELGNKNPESGLIFQLGLGFLQHKIKIDYRAGEIHQLSEEMMKGYDRLSNGPALRQSIGYQFMGKRNLANFYIGLEITEAFTKSKRGFNYDTGKHDNESRLDIYSGARFGWIIPFRKRRSDTYYYY